MSLLQNLPVKWKLTWFSVLSSSIALALACGSFLVYERITFRDAMVRNLSTQAQIIAFNVGSAVLFNDPAAATETLAALRAEPHITAISIYTAQGKLFASYVRAGSSEKPALPVPTAGSRGYHFESKQLVLFQDVIADGVSVGRVYLQSDLREMDERVLRYGTIALVVLLASLALGGLISSRLQRIISQPILDLVDVARTISIQKSYALRVTADGRDELGLLGKSFNEMLAQIETRDSDLHRAHQELELRVEARTEELRKEILERGRLEQQLRAKNVELENQNRQVEQATRLKSEFLANMSHELRTPLNAIIGFSELIHDGIITAEHGHYKESLGYILTSGRHLLKLINDVLDLSKVEAGKVEFYPETLELPGLVGEVVSILRTTA
ncbi:MAG TPA: CHASE sensor domain-containing protein, partial [Polyangiaceae bacterium]|nr:CHASE sensor domain-containing protein [Polyangiaceae bacterium]